MSIDAIKNAQALLADHANKQTDEALAFVWDDVVCPPNAADTVRAIARAELPTDLTIPFVITARNMSAFWYKACGAGAAENVIGLESEWAWYKKAHEQWAEALRQHERRNSTVAHPGPEPVPPDRSARSDWKYYAFPADKDWIKLPLFNPWPLNGSTHKSGFHDIVLYADNHPEDPNGGAFDFSMPAAYPHEAGLPFNHWSHGSERPYYTPYSREDASELYFHNPARQHTRFDTREEKPDLTHTPLLPVWSPSVEHIVPRARFPAGPAAPRDDTVVPPPMPKLVPASTADLPLLMRYAYGPNDPNGWMLERGATNALRGNEPLSFDDGPGGGWRVPASERGRVARKWLYMLATYRPMDGEFLPPDPTRPRSHYVVSEMQRQNAQAILAAARSPIRPDELAADGLMRATYGWGNPLLSPAWQRFFLGGSTAGPTSASSMFEDIVFSRPPAPRPPTFPPPPFPPGLGWGAGSGGKGGGKGGGWGRGGRGGRGGRW